MVFNSLPVFYIFVEIKMLIFVVIVEEFGFEYLWKEKNDLHKLHKIWT